ncbi:MarR family winged helix-turn-helix transcriptional regulator [Flavobacterium sp. J27]|uniref:MarR family winged helix-turn-helix transcriptional regulator n=1 Tax=Flavobacterium sp. J27 TaxID=2060419 RepID=UPI0010322A25|nr:MarR family transcriptional regulator [Flavobacterium sp. J27]
MKDYLIVLEIEGLSSRIKRLSDALLYSTRDLYKSEDLDIEPNWNLIFRLLQQNEAMTITEIADALQFSHPAVIKIINKMKKTGYVTANLDDKDKRKQNIILTQKAIDKLPILENYWKIGTEVIQNLIDDSPNFLEELLKIEEKVNQKSYKERALEKLKETK